MAEVIVKPVVATPMAPPQVVVVQAEKSEAAAQADEVMNKPVEDVKDLIPTDHYLTSPLFHEIAQFFGIPSSEYESAKDKLSVITDYVITKENSNKLEDVMMGIRKLEDNMQPPAWGEKRYDNLYRYIRLATQRDSVDKAMNALERTVKYA